ncbi:hypothetical protein [Sphingomonas alpina]|uniref:Protein activator of alkane oxidation PraB n=1 Tax=Sphingomonas alpina TaxID=653931 RepID=A0A7H0LKJ9_9SPHN|nr:hypothetical protein [Sphingomonas alpina]QNQ10202.1 hypothetical protein H3Z74_02875 [Sphingomonas alpina]
MNKFAKTAMLAVVAMGMTAVPAYANNLSSPGAGTTVNASGSISVNIFGLGARTCAVTMTGTVTSATPGVITFTSGTATGTGCTSSGTGSVAYPIVVRATSQTVVTVDTLSIATPLGTCTKNNVAFNWNNSTSTATSGSQSVGICTMSSATLSVSPAVVIAP